MVDRFWKLFWIGSGGVTLIGLAIALSLFTIFTRQGNLLSAVGVTYQEGKDPFEGSTLAALGAGNFYLPSGYLYQNSLPLHFSSWTWEGVADWRSAEEKYEGTYALKTVFVAPGGTVGMNGPEIEIKDMNSVSLAVYADPSVGDLYINLYDKNGNALGMQSLGWYASSTRLTPNTWERIVVPLHNFGALPKTITGFSISGKNPGTAYVDSVQLSKFVSEHAAWVVPPEILAQAYNPFATSTPMALPYTFTPTSESLSRWFTYFGSFGPGSTGEIEAGPLASTKSTGSMSVIRSGRNWNDYQIDATLDWGQASVFSLMARFVSDGDFVTCAYSRYGETVQMYNVVKGTSNFISQTPPLAVKDYEPWVGVKVGMAVKGNRASCSIDGNEVLHADLPVQAQGTAGIETWDSNPAAAPHIIKSFVVTSLSGE